MRKLHLFLTAAAALVLLASCSDSDSLTASSQQANETPENAITFDTSIGKSKQTRAAGGTGGASGSITTDVLKKDGYGFGVFAYYTTDVRGTDGNLPYAEWRNLGTTKTNRYPNFMYNEKVYWSGTSWKYNDIRYWPNDLANGDVDDQNNDMSTDAAQGSGQYGRVSFFAYAPHVDFKDGAENSEAISTYNGQKTLGTTADGAADGIIAFSGNQFSGDEKRYSDPRVTYVIPASSKKQVDLLWGTAGNNGVNVAGQPNTGVQGVMPKAADAATYEALSDDGKYKDSILNDYTVNADLTKQTTKGTVDFAFKHALAKIGGSYVGTGVGDDENGTTPTNGLMVILDIDKDGAESGGSLQAYPGTPLETGSKAEWNLYKTKATINEIVLSCTQEWKDDGTGKMPNDPGFTYTEGTNTQQLRDKGVLNLATGQWTEHSHVYDAGHTQTILPSGAKVGAETDADDSKKDAVLSEELAEPNSAPLFTKAGFESLPIGVTTVAKNVYEKEAQPFVFLPGTKPIVEITITYTVRTYDKKLANKYTEVKQKIKKRLYITDAVKLNKQYNILMHLGLTSVKFTASVSDWDATDITGTTTPGEGGESPVTIYDEEVEHVYLPRNVGEPDAVRATFTAAGDIAAITAGTTTTTVGSAGVSGSNGLTLTKAEVSFDEGTNYSEVNMTHVLMSSDESWVNIDNANHKVTIDANTTPDTRTAKLLVIYDNKPQEITITQYGRAVEDSPVLSFFTDKDRTASFDNTTTNVVSGIETYYARVTYSYKERNKDNATPGSAITGQTTDTNFTLEEVATDKFLTFNPVDKTTFTTTQRLSVDTRSHGSGEGVQATFGGKTTATQPITQNGATISGLRLTFNNSTADYTISKDAQHISFELFARLKDSNNVDLGFVQDMNGKIDDTDGTNKAQIILTDGSPAWRARPSGWETGRSINVTANSGDKRSFKVKAKIGTIESNEVTVTQNSGK